MRDLRRFVDEGELTAQVLDETDRRGALRLERFVIVLEAARSRTAPFGKIERRRVKVTTSIVRIQRRRVFNSTVYRGRTSLKRIGCERIGHRVARGKRVQVVAAVEQALTVFRKLDCAGEDFNLGRFVAGFRLGKF